jgi:hypothetical protein
MTLGMRGGLRAADYFFAPEAEVLALDSDAFSSEALAARADLALRHSLHSDHSACILSRAGCPCAVGVPWG